MLGRLQISDPRIGTPHPPIRMTAWPKGFAIVENPEQGRLQIREDAKGIAPIALMRPTAEGPVLVVKGQKVIAIGDPSKANEASEIVLAPASETNGDQLYVLRDGAYWRIGDRLEIEYRNPQDRGGRALR
ncbi:MAG: hypothetical protein HYR71_01240 [Chloroflexi bacterium]|nr:hypothetical protein [Chloroflexota bacterium]